MHRLLLPGLILLGHTSAFAFAQPADSTRSEWEFLPGAALLPPFPASPEEPRTGIRKEIGTSRMTLSIGGQLDLVEWRPGGDPGLRIRAGAQIFMYALTTNYQGLRLQMDAADGYFGGYLVGRQQGPTSALTLRFRIMHLSSHMLDGNYDPNTGEWKDGREPVPLSRDFGELLGAYSWLGRNWEVMVYSGLSYATLVRPPELMAVEHPLRHRCPCIPVAGRGVRKARLRVSFGSLFPFRFVFSAGNEHSGSGIENGNVGRERREGLHQLPQRTGSFPPILRYAAIRLGAGDCARFLVDDGCKDEQTEARTSLPGLCRFTQLVHSNLNISHVPRG